MICSIPLQRGFAYFEASPAPRPRLVSLSKDSFGVPLEAATPLLPLDATPRTTGKVAIGVLCYCQSNEQVAQIRRLPAVAPTVKTPTATTAKQPEFSLFDAVLSGLVTLLIIRGIIQ
jgi:hypothetical protein